jgi:hypothetical protein
MNHWWPVAVAAAGIYGIYSGVSLLMRLIRYRRIRHS